MNLVLRVVLAVYIGELSFMDNMANGMFLYPKAEGKDFCLSFYLPSPSPGIFLFYPYSTVGLYSSDCEQPAEL